MLPVGINADVTKDLMFERPEEAFIRNKKRKTEEQGLKHGEA